MADKKYPLLGHRSYSRPVNTIQSWSGHGQSIHVPGPTTFTDPIYGCASCGHAEEAHHPTTKRCLFGPGYLDLPENEG